MLDSMKELAERILTDYSDESVARAQVRALIERNEATLLSLLIEDLSERVLDSTVDLQLAALVFARFLAELPADLVKSCIITLVDTAKRLHRTQEGVVGSLYHMHTSRLGQLNHAMVEGLGSAAFCSALNRMRQLSPGDEGFLTPAHFAKPTT